MTIPPKLITQSDWDRAHRALRLLGIAPEIHQDANGDTLLIPEPDERALAFLADAVAGAVAPDDDDHEAWRVAATKWESRRRIEAVFPSHQQANWSRYAMRLLSKQSSGQELTADEKLDADFAEQAAQWIDSVRAASDAIEEEEGVSPFSDAAPWPAMPDPDIMRPCPKVF